MRISLFFLMVWILPSCIPNDNVPKEEQERSIVYDHHVHLMSPTLIAEWKAIGVPFSKPDSHYDNIDTILSLNPADRIDLISMAYVYGNPAYYSNDDAFERMQAENDYLLQSSNAFPERVRPFIAVDPLKDYAMGELIRCQALNPEIGLKLHFNTSQVYLTEASHLEKVKPIFSKAADFQIPILLHFDNRHPRFGKPDLEILVDSILQHIPALNLKFAHFGSSGGFNPKTKNFMDAFMGLQAEGRIPKRHRILFDISAVALDKDSDSEGVSKLSDSTFLELRAYIDKLGLDHIAFGTDYPLYRTLDYLKALQEKVGFSEEEIQQILKN